MVTFIKFVMEQPETVSQKSIFSIIQVMMEAQGRKYLEMSYLCAVIAIERGCP